MHAAGATSGPFCATPPPIRDDGLVASIDPSGYVPARRVRLVGEVVHVTPHARSGFVATLLTHLEVVGFCGAPRWLGRSAHGDDVFTYIEGAVFEDGPYNLQDKQLMAAAVLIREFHDAAAGSGLCEGQETICHGDLGPHNTVFRGGRPVALIDWDGDVRPGRRAVDFADAVWSFTDLTSQEVPVAEQARRVKVMCAVYPPMTPAVVVSELRSQFDRARSRHQAAQRLGPVAVFDGLLAWIDRHGSSVAASG